MVLRIDDVKKVVCRSKVCLDLRVRTQKLTISKRCGFEVSIGR